ncbi:hydrocephalus-inducing protein-like isoform X6 [Motacilla alba alba]|uniref:hydrocephalus-inducing protein-like isoform X6 n=1 Tax=Motacilla alba alba TaxID=1094192 RepID=UPI0018D5288C|nr:hydrocephalus-inducing protein-like isoform X6 [Motacilla alba alba]
MWDPHGLGSAFAGELLLLLPRCFALLHSPFSLQRCANMKPSAGLVSPWGCRQCLLRPPKEVSQENFPEETKAEKVKGFCGDAPALLSSMGQEKMAKVPEEPMLFCDDIFSIEPMEGEIGPNCSAKVQVTFKPLEALEYGRVAYCSISGRESRLPLHLRGEGQGPLVELSSHTLNLGNILVNTPQVYEVKLINQGALDAPFTRIPSATNGGFCFKFAPEEGIIAAGGSQTLQISFRATVLGSFEEEFQFRVAGSPRPAILTIKGSVTGPSLRFDLPELDFGDISFGFPYTQSCRLTNTSAVPLTFKLRMSDDGTQPAVDSVDQIRRHSDPAWRKGIHFYVEPREFTMNPSHGTILPQGHQDIQVTLCSNTVMEFYRRLLVDVEGIGKGVASLPITASSSDCPGVISLPRCLVPKLQVYPQVLLYEECQLKVPYERKLFISNPSHLPGCYGLIPQKRKEDSPVLYSSPRPCGIVQPHSIAEIPVLVEVQALGTHRTNVLIGVFGDERNPLAFSVLPLSAVLQPGESQQVSSTVSGHLNTISSVPALCHVEGGPTCEVGVTGGASRVSSSLSPRGINCGSRAPLRERRELKRLAPKLGEEAKALEEEERRKKEKKGVPVGKQPPKPEKGKTKPPGKKETKASEKKETNIPKKETKPAEKKETKAPGKKETKAPEKDTKPPEKKESKVLKNKTKFPENKNKPPEKKESKIPERKAAKIQEKETKAPEKKEAKAPKKGEPKAPKKGEPKAYYSVRY